MKKFRINVQRTYNTWINVEEKSLRVLEEKLALQDEDLWDKIYEQEMEDMDVEPINWEIYDNNTITGALSPDTGPRS
jgi:hypothetical protein|tara:strand:- start:304 stop:534 length:231 start_codon:yes stop_codon:yes gene_type:complete